MGMPTAGVWLCVTSVTVSYPRLCVGDVAFLLLDYVLQGLSPYLLRSTDITSRSEIDWDYCMSVFSCCIAIIFSWLLSLCSHWPNFGSGSQNVGICTRIVCSDATQYNFMVWDTRSFLGESRIQVNNSSWFSPLSHIHNHVSNHGLQDTLRQRFGNALRWYYSLINKTTDHIQELLMNAQYLVSPNQDPNIGASGKNTTDILSPWVWLFTLEFSNFRLCFIFSTSYVWISIFMWIFMATCLIISTCCIIFTCCIISTSLTISSTSILKA